MVGSTLTDEEVQLLRPRHRAVSSEEYISIPRLVERNLPFHQSISMVSVQNKIKNKIPLFLHLTLEI